MNAFRLIAALLQPHRTQFDPMPWNNDGCLGHVPSLKSNTLPFLPRHTERG